MLRVEDIDSQKFEDYLYTRGLPAPDLLIRPGGDLPYKQFYAVADCLCGNLDYGSILACIYAGNVFGSSKGVWRA